MTLHRMQTPKDARTQATERFSKHVTRLLDAEFERQRRRAETLAKVSGPATAAIGADAAAMTALRSLAPEVEAERQRFQALAKFKTALRPRNLSLTVNPGLNIITPPYDTAWTSSLLNDANDNDGTFSCAAIDTLGYQAAGLGVFLFTQQETEVRFSADAQFDTAWSNWLIEPGGFGATYGEVCVLIYEDQAVLYDERANLWYNFLSTPGQPASSQDSVFLTQTTIGQSYFLMKPGKTYNVWVWAYTSTALTGTGIVASVIKAQMPFIVVEKYN
jgi:hypothetical protein